MIDNRRVHTWFHYWAMGGFGFGRRWARPAAVRDLRVVGGVIKAMRFGGFGQNDLDLALLKWT